MHAVRTLLALTVAALAAACASPGHDRAAPPSAGMAPMTMGAASSMAAAQPRMRAMQDMHQKMANARSAPEREALMADHMKAMQGGMAMMKEMQATHAGSGAAGMGMSTDMAKRHQMMADHMAMMQMMMDMMADRMPPAAVGK